MWCVVCILKKRFLKPSSITVFSPVVPPCPRLPRTQQPLPEVRTLCPCLKINSTRLFNFLWASFPQTSSPTAYGYVVARRHCCCVSCDPQHLLGFCAPQGFGVDLKFLCSAGTTRDLGTIPPGTSSSTSGTRVPAFTLTPLCSS